MKGIYRDTNTDIGDHARISWTGKAQLVSDVRYAELGGTPLFEQLPTREEWIRACNEKARGE